MTMRRLVYGCATLAMVGLSALVTGVAAAEDKAPKGAKDDPQAMMAAYEKAGEPAEQHKVLQKLVGKWNLTMKSWMDPKAPPMESTGTAEGKSVLGDRFVQTTVNSTFMGKSFSGIGVAGYDKSKKKYVGTWIDSMSTGIMRSEGSSDPAGKVMTSQMVGTDPLTGKETKMKIIEKWETDDKMIQEFMERKGGKEVKTMEITYSRAK